MNAEIRFYLALLIRRLPAMALLFLVASAIGVVLAIRLPTVYAANARLLVEAPQISEQLVQSTVQVSATEEIEIIRQQLLTRANLIDIARARNVFADVQRMPADDVVSEMRAATDIRARGGRGGPTLVDVSFRARTGSIAAAVVNEYVTRITSANVQNRQDAAGDTLGFFEQERERLEQELATKLSVISAFQRENVGALPDGQSYRLNRQSDLQERLGGIGRDIASLEEQRDAITRLFETTGRVTAPGQRRLSPAEQRVAQLEAEIEEALLTFSESNPRVTQLRARLERAQEQLAASAGATGDDVEDPQAALFDLQMTTIAARIQELREQIPGIEQELAELQVAIDRAPLNGITLAGLQRDYDNVRVQYDQATAGLNAARMGERIESSARGQRITLIEAASVPTEPASPNRPMVALAGAGIGGVLAVALFVLLELMNSTVRRPAEIAAKLGVAPLATIPYLETGLNRFWRRAGRVAAFAVVLLGVPAALWAVDTYYMPLDLLMTRVLDRLGV